MSDKTQQDKEKNLSLEKDSQINVVVNRQGEDDVIDLMNVFHKFKVMGRVYVWVLVLCMVLGVCAPLLMYQFSGAGKEYRVSSAVTLDYDTIDDSDPQVSPFPKPVEDLSAPDGTDLDLTQVTSAYVLNNALNGLVLSEDISIAQLRDNIKVERILTEDSRRQQEVASKMLEDRNSGAYDQLQNVELTYVNHFIVSLDNGFADAEGDKKIYLPNDELAVLLNRVLDSYNDYLAMTYADFKLPGDAISVIDTDNLDIMESLDQLRSAMDDLYDYCDDQTEEVKAYRSYRDGRSLFDLMETLQTARDVNVEYLYSHVYANSIAKDREEMLSKYRYLLREAQTKLDVANEHIATTAEILASYKYDQISVENKDKDSSKSTKLTTDYYNELVLQQAKNYDEAAELSITIDDLEMKIANLETNTSVLTAEQAQAELTKAISVCSKVYDSICAQMEEIMATPFYTTYADATAAQGVVQPNFLSANLKKMILGALVGAFLGFGLWFVVAFAAEMKHGRKDSEREVEQ
ncbi:MAG: hypothetical protein IKI01_09380 [Lachnospiraceae bacterium]|nr:hypothetical protein [Lachnospiraceae bacterium]